MTIDYVKKEISSILSSINLLDFNTVKSYTSSILVNTMG